MKTNIFLIGFMGAGKSTVARLLEQEYGMHRIEMDEKIEAEQHMTIPDIFSAHGEEYFRGLETELLERLQGQEHTVVSCGGGVPLRRRNVEAMKKSGTVVCLSAAPETVYERVKNFHNRPLLEGNMNVEYISALLEQRRARYLEAADAVIETDEKSAEEICREIHSLCQNGVQRQEYR